MKYRKKIERAWPEALLLFSGSFRSGLNLEEAISILVHESPDPLRSLLMKRWENNHKWMPRARLIQHLFSEPYLDLVRAGLLLSHESGAGQSEIVERCAKLIKEKLEFKEKVQILTAQGRFTAWTVGLSPVFLILALKFISPDLMDPLFQTSLGHVLLGVVLLLNAVGLFLVHRMSRIEP